MDIKSNHQKILADLATPVGLFLRIREKYSQVLLLESSDYSSKADSMSFICFEPLATIKIVDGVLNDSQKEFNIVDEIATFLDSFNIETDATCDKFNGIFGYSTFDAVQYFEEIKFEKQVKREGIPELRYDLYRYVIAFDHFHNEMTLIENCPNGDSSTLDSLKDFISRQDYQTFDFNIVSDEQSPISDKKYMEMVSKAKEHCKRGDVFQIVLARRYEQKYKGDDFNVYRCLRSINPSPYLFYFDYGSYKIFGSSPEAQIKVQDGVAEIHPIAGTFRKTEDAEENAKLAEQLKADPKESSEHVMLVDLARNDLSKNCTNVEVTSYKEVQYFSHVIHLTSVVKGDLNPEVTAFQIFADTFPAGTLSGAPKYKAMELIHEYEAHARTFYGGGIGLIQFNGNLNHAIIIRSFLSQGNVLRYQAGAGLVIDSKEESELQEVKNKLAALKQALVNAEKI